MPTRRNPPRKKQALDPLVPRLFKIAPAESDTLQSLAQDASDRIGRTVGSAGVLRALIRLAGASKIKSESIAEAVEEELQAGRRWGAKKE